MARGRHPLLVAAVAAIAACYAPKAPLDQPCSGLGECPDGQICVANACVAPGSQLADAPLGAADAPREADALVIDAPPVDSDGDGIPDDRDNCPHVANPDQADEDADGLGDVCDPCPPFAGSADSDGDGLPDACDPNPSVAGDKIVEFDGFGSGLPAGWQATGAWTATGGDAVVTSGSAVVSTLVLAESKLGSGPLTVSGHVTIDAIFGTASNRSAGLIADWDGSSRGIVCELALNSSDNGLVALLDSQTSVGNSRAATIVVGAASDLAETESGTAYACASSLAPPALTATQTFAPTGPQIGLRSRGMSAHFAWLMVVASPEAPPP
nr:thrombospondin type 3 repeat-containing protein [Kofleriaceae bacterium]